MLQLSSAHQYHTIGAFERTCELAVTSISLLFYSWFESYEQNTKKISKMKGVSSLNHPWVSCNQFNFTKVDSDLLSMHDYNHKISPGMIWFLNQPFWDFCILHLMHPYHPASKCYGLHKPDTNWRYVAECSTFGSTLIKDHRCATKQLKHHQPFFQIINFGTFV